MYLVLVIRDQLATTFTIGEGPQVVGFGTIRCQ